MSVLPELDVTIVGGCGHVGLPLGAAFAGRGLQVALYDIDAEAVATVNRGVAPFREAGLDELVAAGVRDGRLVATTDPGSVGRAEAVIVVVGTPIDGRMNPDLDAFLEAIRDIAGLLHDDQLLVLRSTVYPGVTTWVDGMLRTSGKTPDVSFCPERIAEGHALTELFELPQIVSGCSPGATDRAEKLFRNLTQEVVRLSPEEAELAKLFTNTWRYIKFAAANQLYMIANDFGLDFESIRSAITYGYPRAADMPSAGFAAGPCLFKDTAQLAAFNNNNFTLGHASTMINEGLPLYIVARLARRFDLRSMTVGILGMAFKGDSDDPRASLSYKLKQVLSIRAAHVLCTDPFVRDDDDLVPLEDVLRQSDLVIVGAPHSVYRDVAFDGPVADVWNLMGRGVRI